MTNDETEQPIASIPPFGLRIRSGLRRQIEQAARENGRSMNSEIVARLEASFRDDARSKRAMQNLLDLDFPTDDAPSTAARVGRSELRLDDHEKRFDNYEKRANEHQSRLDEHAKEIATLRQALVKRTRS